MSSIRPADRCMVRVRSRLALGMGLPIRKAFNGGEHDSGPALLRQWPPLVGARSRTLVLTVARACMGPGA
jgi:hypothetical protein